MKEVRITMRIIWLLSMGAKVEGIFLLAVLIGIALGLIIGKITENKWVTIFTAVLPVIFGVIAVIRLLINSWENVMFERPILVGIISLIIYVILHSVNGRLFHFWGRSCFDWWEKTDPSETIIMEETREENIKICETDTEK